MEKTHEYKELNGVDGGIMSLNEENGEYLIMIEHETENVMCSVWITKEELQAFVDKME